MIITIERKAYIKDIEKSGRDMRMLKMIKDLSFDNYFLSEDLSGRSVKEKSGPDKAPMGIDYVIYEERKHK